MRLLGTIEGQGRAERFVAYLLTLDVPTHVEPADKSSDHWDVWIRDEDRVELAKGEFVAFLADSDHAKYAEAIRAAQDILRTKKQKATEISKRIRTMRHLDTSRRVPPMTLTLVILSGLITLLSDFMAPGSSNVTGKTILRQLRFVDEVAYQRSQGDPLASIKQGQGWRLITPIFMHGSTLHLVMGMIMLIQFGRMIEWREGTARFAMIVLIIAVLSNFLQGTSPVNWMGSPYFGGMSGVIYGLFGYHWVKSTFRPDLLPPLASLLIGIMMIWLAMGVADEIAGGNKMHIANLCHLGGLVAGSALGWICKDWTRAKNVARS